MSVFYLHLNKLKLEDVGALIDEANQFRDVSKLDRDGIDDNLIQELREYADAGMLRSSEYLKFSFREVLLEVFAGSLENMFEFFVDGECLDVYSNDFVADQCDAAAVSVESFLTRVCCLEFDCYLLERLDDDDKQEIQNALAMFKRQAAECRARDVISEQAKRAGWRVYRGNFADIINDRAIVNVELLFINSFHRAVIERDVLLVGTLKDWHDTESMKLVAYRELCTADELIGVLL